MKLYTTTEVQYFLREHYDCVVTIQLERLGNISASESPCVNWCREKFGKEIFLYKDSSINQNGWFIYNEQSVWDYFGYDGCVKVYFKNTNDAILFKLKWA